MMSTTHFNGEVDAAFSRLSLLISRSSQLLLNLPDDIAAEAVPPNAPDRFKNPDAETHVSPYQIGNSKVVNASMRPS